MGFPQALSGDNIGGGKNTTKQSENNLADIVGGERHRYSGADPEEKGDVSCEGLAFILDKEILFDHKETVKMSYRLTQDDLIKLESEAINSFRVPSLVIQFSEPKRKMRYFRWILLPLETVRPIKEYRNNKAIENRASFYRNFSKPDSKNSGEEECQKKMTRTSVFRWWREISR